MNENFDKTPQIRFPPGIIFILSELRTHGHAAYAVGGCVRDSLLGKIPDDWDVTTSALPDEVMHLFGESAVPTGLKHGTVTVKAGGGSAEVTTFRSDGVYTDHRRPDSVRFVPDVREDLARRDFTMNAIAAPLKGGLVDPFGGQGDIKRGIIRCVGEPERRFSEDALRMLRAVRFSAKLGFVIEPQTLGAIYRLSPLARELAPERVAVELIKTLCAENAAGPLGLLLSSGLMDSYVLPGKAPELSALESLPCEKGARLSGLCALLQRERRIDTELFLRRLRLDMLTVKCVSSGVSAALSGLPHSTPEWKRLLCRIGGNACRCAVYASCALGHGNAMAQLKAVLESGECLSLAGLDIGGRELLALGYSGRDVGKTLDWLLEHVFEHPEDNQREKLLSMAVDRRGKV